MPFSRTPGISLTILENGCSLLALFLTITVLHRPGRLNNTDECCRPNQKCQTSNLRCRTYQNSTRILTCFPFSITPIRSSIRINLPLTERHGQGTLALSVTLILTMLCSYYHQDSHYYSIHAFSRTRFCSSSTPAYHLSYENLKYRKLL